MQISERLRTVAEAVKFGGVVADVGCDHALTAVYMVKNGIADRVIAADIGRAPLMRAVEHIEAYGLGDRIETRLSDGLCAIGQGEVNAVLISGMGGALMSGILRGGKAVLSGVRELVLSPQSEMFLIRRFLQENDFLIDREYMLSEQGKYYVVIHAVHGNEPLYGQIEEIYGRRLLQERNPVLMQFLKGELRRIDGILGKLQKNGMSDMSEKRKLELHEEREMVEQALGRGKNCVFHHYLSR